MSDETPLYDPYDKNTSIQQQNVVNSEDHEYVHSSHIQSNHSQYQSERVDGNEGD